MALAMNKRNIFLGGALLLTLLATIWVSLQEEPQQDTEIGLPRHRVKSADIALRADTTDAQDTSANSDGYSYPRKSDQAAPVNLFKSHSWFVPPPPPKKVMTIAPPPPPPPPVAPPSPFSYLGKLEDTPDGTLYFLTASNRVYSVIKGQNIDSNWRLDSEEANAIRLTYLPLGLVQTFSKLNNPAGSR